MEFTLSDTYRVVPRWKGNHESDNPAVFICRYLTEAERTAIVGHKTRGIHLEVVTNLSELLRVSVVRIDNLWINGQEIKTVEQLLECRGIIMLLNQVTNEIMANNIDPADIKKN